jgi:hypothetical protein
VLPVAPAFDLLYLQIFYVHAFAACKSLRGLRWLAQRVEGAIRRRPLQHLLKIGLARRDVFSDDDEASRRAIHLNLVNAQAQIGE